MAGVKQKYSDKYEMDIKKHLLEIQISPKTVELDTKGIDYNNLKQFDQAEIDLVFHKYNTILNTFIHGNSFIGNEYFIIRYTVHQILLYWLILKNEDLTNDEKNTCILEIETQFYFYLNCIYNIKEKFELFVNYQANRHALDNSILNNHSINALLKLFKNKYSVLEQYCKARSYVVHNSFSIDYIIEDDKINVSCFSFRLTSEKADEDIKNCLPLIFGIGFDKLIEPIKSIHDLIIESLNIFKNMKNLELVALIKKYQSDSEGNSVFRISF